MAPADRDRLLALLLDERQRFLTFIAGRVGGNEAEDVLQEAFVRALRRAEDLRDEQRLVPWFFQLVRNVLIDRARARDSAGRRDAA